jgi:hypothetical protein
VYISLINAIRRALAFTIRAGTQRIGKNFTTVRPAEGEKRQPPPNPVYALLLAGWLRGTDKRLGG